MTATLTAPAPTLTERAVDASVDYDVTKVALRTVNDGLSVPMTDAVVRQDPDGKRQVIGTVGRRYQVVDHRDVLRGFAEVLTTGGVDADVAHEVYKAGARVYSRFTLKTTVKFGDAQGMQHDAEPFITLMNSHDGSRPVGFTLGARVNGVSFVLGTQVYAVSVKHVNGVRLERVLDSVNVALEHLVNVVLPKWSKLVCTSVSFAEAERTIAQLVEDKVISEQKAKEVSRSCTTLWDLYASLVGKASEVGKRDDGEGAHWRNARVNDKLLDKLT